MQHKAVSNRTQRAEEMFSLVKKYLASDLKQKEFCRRESIAHSTFQWWLHEYRYKDKRISSEKKITKNFIALPPVSSTVLCQPSCSIEYPNGVVIRFSSPIDFQIISQLVQIQGQ